MFISSPLLHYKKRIRVICKQPYLAHINPLFMEQNYLKLKDLYDCSLALYLFKNQDYNDIVVTPSHHTRLRYRLHWATKKNFFQSLTTCTKFQVFTVSCKLIEIPFFIYYGRFRIICICTFQRKCHSRHLMLYTIIRPQSFQGVSF